ncbi:hypothetical protein [Streptomyces sp. NPDC004050]
MKWATFRTVKPYTADSFPAPVTSEGARVLLWDAEQIKAYVAGRSLPALPDRDTDGDLLDRQEAAAVVGVAAKSWDSYKRDQRVAPFAVKVHGVEHWPREVIERFRDSRGVATRPVGRPSGAGDIVPRDLLPAHIDRLLEQDPAVTAAYVVEVLGISIGTAQKHLARARGAMIAARVQAEPGLDAEHVAVLLGFPKAVRRSALAAAHDVLVHSDGG